MDGVIAIGDTDVRECGIGNTCGYGLVARGVRNCWVFGRGLGYGGMGNVTCEFGVTGRDGHRNFICLRSLYKEEGFL